MTDTLGVTIVSNEQEVRVGTLIRDEADMMSFEVDRSYIERGESRPLLSSSVRFLGDEDRTVQMLQSGTITQPGRDLHPWFSNLLPEGALRDLVNKGLPSGRTSDFDVLAYLGHDLPGAVVVRAEGGANYPTPPLQEIEEAGGPKAIRFSLAGVQLKMSMMKQDERLTFPATGINGDIIAKLPSPKFEFLPEVEFSSMKLAESAGVSIPNCELVASGSVSDIGEDILEHGAYVLAISRFDRAGGRRIHMEDFCQVLGAPKDRKYTAANEETVVNMSRRFGGGSRSFVEMVRRLTVNILIGNGDAHLKNHSLLYVDGASGSLTPAYDIVPTFLYDGKDDLALKFRETVNPFIVKLQRFERVAELCGIPAKIARKVVTDTVEKAADTWSKELQDLPMPAHIAKKVVERTHRLALVQELQVSF
ncbi:type II toxin-antitoxin system HipA family toxin [Agrobacterium rosae]|uniref:type II toxin-antitoxin system HipA family toxin n=1 Tax=Agrobacterium rosae TaxID=1972867 RepID=UPI002A0F5BA6|nr:HipA domain-containing protein [Agrobacterium rosae]MDX8315881.1 HipA domain-containing protein [Agrobacterium rosae]